jgi:hypothetical protein
MKKVSLFLITMLIAVIGYSQETYKVIKVNGQIEIQKSKQKLISGMEFSDKEKLVFTPNSNAAVINSKKGRMTLSGSQANNETNFLPAMGNISSRKIAFSNVDDLRNHFTGNYVILNNAEVSITLTGFPMNEDNLFYVQYKYNGEDINKKLKYEGSTLLIDKDYIFKIDEKPIPIPDSCKMRLYYFKKLDNSHQFIGEFNPIFPNLEVLKKEVDIVLKELATKEKNEKITQVVSYINDFYGKVDNDSVKKWLASNFNL